MSASARGSSPLARGLRHGRACLVVEGRIIPARAGFTDGDRRVRARRRDHPRSRGVYCPPGTAGSGATGSSPLARGLRPSRPEHERGEGIIPARAGFTRRRAAPGRRPRDHPRSRGVYDPVTAPRSRGGGSSPLARGLRVDRGGRIHRRGIIPARAGFTSGAALRLARSVDHPRSRGVYWPGRFRGDRRRGSSPLARGLRPARVPGRGSPGIIPARAGFTLSPPTTSPTPAGSSPLARGLRRPGRRRSSDAPDHPRSRGVYATRSMGGAISRGSSPLARGLRPAPRARGPARWIIPARAGFTDRTRRGPLICRDHPRSRGVYAA